MNGFEKFVAWLQPTMTTPEMYGLFHIISLLLVIIITTLLCWRCRNCSEKAFKWIITGCWILMVVMELYKQLVFSMDVVDGKAVWDYQWYAFPFQLCSTPLYTLPIIAFCKEGKFRDSVIAYICTFALFGGLVTMFYPSTVFIKLIGINIQTMTHHGLQVILGVFILVHERKRLSLRFFVNGIYVFLVAFGIAMISNLIFHAVSSETFNMFYISPYYETLFPLTILYDIHYALFIIFYIVGFIVAAFGVYCAQYYIIKACIKERKPKETVMLDAEEKTNE